MTCFFSLIFIFCTFSTSLGDKFTITTETWPNANGPDVLLKRITNINSNESVAIIYSPGGRLAEINLQSQSKKAEPISMIAGYGKNASMVYANPDFRGCALMPWANRIANATYNFFGKEYILPITPQDGARNDALHGFMVNQTFNVQNETITDNYATIKLCVTFSKELNNLYPGYPHSFTVSIEYRLNATGQFDVEITAKNIAESSGEAMPFYAGFHPYFAVGNVSQSMIELDANCDYVNLDCGRPPQTAPLIPTGYSKPWNEFNGKNAIGVAEGNMNGMPTYFDDAYKVIGQGKKGIVRNKIIDPLRKNTFVLWQDENFKFNQLYTGLAYKNGEQAIAFEPQSASTNAYNNGDHLSVLYPQESITMTFGFYVE